MTSEPTASDRASTSELMQREIQELLNRVDRLESDKKKPQRFTPSVIVSLLALLFSFGTTAVSWHRTSQQDIQDSRKELRTLLERLVLLPRENQELLLKYNDAPNVRGQLSSMINQENIILAGQAAEIAARIPDQVTATEHLGLFAAFQGSGLAAAHLDLLDRAIKGASNPIDVVTARRTKGIALLALQRVDAGRAEFMSALQGMVGYPDAYVSAVTDALTEIYWSQAEYASGHCPEAKVHITKAADRLTRLPDVPYTLQIRGQMSQTLTDIKKNCP